MITLLLMVLAVEPLWPAGAPLAIGNEPADAPTLTFHLPKAEASVHAAVVVCPGGGYRNLALGHEGADVARWLNARGIAAVVLAYRLGPRYHHPAQLLDVLRAVRTVRARAAQLGIARDKIGVWGFSAGGHLASSAATLFDDPDGVPKGSKDPIDKESGRPDFAILTYPVIQMAGPLMHVGSQKALLGDTPPAALAEKMSTERQVTARTPPTFLFHTTTDKAVPVENAVSFYLALRKAGVPGELHVYEQGPHGVGLAPNDPVLSTWPQRLEDWLRVRGILSVANR